MTSERAGCSNCAGTGWVMWEAPGNVVDGVTYIRPRIDPCHVCNSGGSWSKWAQNLVDTAEKKPPADCMMCDTEESMPIRDDEIELSTKGLYRGHCRLRFNILEQWDGRKWQRVPDVIDRSPQPMGKLHFGPEDFGRD